MNSNELYEEFLNYCQEYELDPWGITIKKDNIYLKIFKPHDPDKNNYLIYELIENSRMSGTISEINELLELCQEIFGEDCIIRNYGYYK